MQERLPLEQLAQFPRATLPKFGASRRRFPAAWLSRESCAFLIANALENDQPVVRDIHAAVSAGDANRRVAVPDVVAAINGGVAIENLLPLTIPNTIVLYLIALIERRIVQAGEDEEMIDAFPTEQLGVPARLLKSPR